MNINIRALLRSWCASLAASGVLSAGMANGAATNFTLYVANQLGYDSTPFTRYFTVEGFDSVGNASVFATNSSFSNPILNSPTSVAIDSSGNVYVVCVNDDTWIEKFDPWGNNAARFVNSTVSYPNAIVFDGSSNLYVAAGDNITKYNSQGSASVFASTNAVGDLVGLAFDAAGNLYASDEYGGLIRKIDTQSNMTTFASPGNNPYGLAFDSGGNLYVALRGSGNIVKYDANTNETPVASLGGSTQPIGLAFDPAGNLYVSEYAANRIVKIDTNASVTVFATQGLNGPVFIAIQPKLYSVDRFIVAGGGGTSSGGIWTISGTAGQADAGIMAGEFLSGELVAVEGGFWAGPVTSLQVASPVIVMGAPIVVRGQVTLPFALTTGLAPTFRLLQSSQITGPWALSASAVLTATGPDNSYSFTVPATGAAEFYRVQSY